MAKNIIFAAIVAGALSNTTQAITVVDLSGLEVEVGVSTTANGGRDFSASLFGSSTASIGAGAEFQVQINSGDFGGGQVEELLDLDFDPSGDVVLTADESFYVGSFFFSEDAAFTIEISFTDPAISVLDATTTGDLASGAAWVSSLDPISWNFVTEGAGGFGGRAFGFNAPPNNVPGLTLTIDSTPVPLPAAFPFLLAGVSFLLRLAAVGRQTAKS